MAGPLGPRKVTPRLRAALEIATASARERLLDAHAAHLLDLVTGVRGQLSPGRAMAIYARLHALEPEFARRIGSKVLAALGERAEAVPFDDAAPDDDWDAALSTFQQLRRRIRGRVNHELRRAIEIHTGRTEIAILNVHVDNILRFVHLLAPETPIARIVAFYSERIGVRKSVAEVAYYMTLDRLADTLTTWPGQGVPAAPTHPAQTLPAAAEHTLRIVNRSPRQPRHSLPDPGRGATTG